MIDTHTDAQLLAAAARTLLPRALEISESAKSCDVAARPTSREVWTIGEARSLPATTVNRRLLRIGDWPTARVVQEVPRGKPKPVDRVPPFRGSTRARSTA